MGCAKWFKQKIQKVRGAISSNAKRCGADGKGKGKDGEINCRAERSCGKRMKSRGEPRHSKRARTGLVSGTAATACAGKKAAREARWRIYRHQRRRSLGVTVALLERIRHRVIL